MLERKYIAHIAIVVANIIFGLNIPVTKSLVANWLTPTGYTFTRMLFGTIVFWAVSLFLPKEKVSVKDLLALAIGGFFGFVATQFLFASALRFTSPVYFSLIMSLTPVLVLILSVLFMKETATPVKIMGTLLSILGAFLIIIQSTKSGSGSNNLLGVGLSVLSALSYAIYLLVTRRISVKYKPVTVVKYMFIFSLLMILLFGFNSFSTQKMFSPEVTTEAIMQLSFALLFSTVLAFFLMPIALSKLKASTVSIYMNLQPLTASTVAVLIGQDSFSWDKILTTALVIVGVYLVTRNEK